MRDIPKNPITRETQMTGMPWAMSRRKREARKAKTKRTMMPVIRSTTTIADDLTRDVEYLEPSQSFSV